MYVASDYHIGEGSSMGIRTGIPEPGQPEFKSRGSHLPVSYLTSVSLFPPLQNVHENSSGPVQLFQGFNEIQ